MSAPPDLPLEPLRRLARSLLYDRTRADDVVQEAWLAALGRTLEPVGMRAWLAEAVRRIARTTGRDELRRTAREERAARPEAQPSAAEATERLEILRRLLDAVDSLDEPYRTAVVLRYLDELPPRAIARRLGVPVNTVRTHVRRGLERLRRDLDGNGRSREELLAALLPFAGKAPWALALGGPALSNPQTIGVFVLKNKLVAAAIVLALLGVSWIALRSLTAADPRQTEAVAVLVANDPDRESSSDPTSASALVPAADSAIERSPSALASSTATWIVRGHATRGNYEPFAGMRLVGRVHAGPKPTGELLLEQRFRADERGDFAWAIEPPSQTVTVAVEPALDGHFYSDRWDVFSPGDPAPEKLKVAAYPLDVTVRGVVRDPKQRPVAGARVLYRTYPEDLEALTGSDGAFAVPFSSYSSEDTIEVVAEGFAQARRNLGVLRPPVSTTPDVILEPESHVRGRVLDEHGAPLAGARVAPLYPYGHVSTTTGNDGAFELGTLPPGGTSRRIAASLAGYVQAEVRLKEGQDEVELRLTRGARVSGRVRSEAGAPVAGAWLSVGETPWPEPRVETWSDADGRFTLELVPPGDRSVWVWRTGFAELRNDFVAPPSGESLADLEIVLPAEHFLSGIVLGETGEPLPWATVYAEDPMPRYPDLLQGFRTYTGRDGRFRMDGLPEMEVKLGVLAGGHARLEQRFTELDRDDVVLRPEPSAGIAGRVVDAETGAPVPSFVLRLVFSATIPPEQRIDGFDARFDRGVTVTSDEGVWSVHEDWKPGQAIGVEVRAEGYAPALAERVDTTRSPDPDACVLRLVRGTRVAGRVVQKGSGNPVAGARVRRFTAAKPLGSSSDGEAGIATASDAAGRFELDGLPSEEMSLAVEAPGFVLTTDGPFPVDGAAPVQRWIELGTGASIRGRLLDGDGRALAGETVSAYALEPATDRRTFETTTGDDGAYALAALPAGKYHVRWERRPLPNQPAIINLDDGRVLDVRAYDLLRLVDLGVDEQRTLDLQPKGKATVRGTITYAGPLPEVVTVMLMPHQLHGEPPSHWATAGRATLAENGQFEATHVEPGTYTVLVNVPISGSSPARGVAQIEVPEEGTVDVALTVERR